MNNAQFGAPENHLASQII